MMQASIGHNGFIEPAAWAWECAQSKAHAYVKLIVHTIRCLVVDGEQEASITDERLADLTSLTVKSVRKYRKMASDEKWFNHQSGRGRSRPSTYRLAIPPKTISELSAAINNIKSGNDRGTFDKSRNEKGTHERVAIEGKEEREGYLSGVGFQKRSPTPPKKNNIYITPSVPTNAARENTHEDKVVVNGSNIAVRVAGRIAKFDYQSIDLWAATAMCPPDTAKALVESVCRGWVCDGRMPEQPSAWMQRQIQRWRVRKASDDGEIAKAKGRNGPNGNNYSYSGNYVGKVI